MITYTYRYAQIHAQMHGQIDGQTGMCIDIQVCEQTDTEKGRHARMLLFS